MQVDVLAVVEGLLKAIGAQYKDISKVEVAGQAVYLISAEDGKPLIGTHGDTIHALDLLIKKMVEKQAGDEADMHFLVDVNEYRIRQIRDLEAKAKVMAERARSFQYDVELSPMSAYERLIVHTALQKEPNVKTESQGEGRSRRVVIKYSAD